MKIRGIEVEPAKEINIIAYQCPYCDKKFFHKNSYYKHLNKKYCHFFFIDFMKKTNDYDNKRIDYKEYVKWCYENGYIEFLNISEEDKKQLGEEFYNKIASMYDYSEEDY